MLTESSNGRIYSFWFLFVMLSYDEIGLEVLKDVAEETDEELAKDPVIFKFGSLASKFNNSNIFIFCLPSLSQEEYYIDVF
jgi:hypothetical protein